jgi:hypothetical protein
MSGNGGPRASEAHGESSADPNSDASELGRKLRGGILRRAIRNQQLWLTLGYFAVLLLLARAYA